jgi:uncharacterized membrane protein YeaQ/YmgE (transglycosylase-associated protein family)
MQVTDYITGILFGALVGVLGRLVIPGRQNIGAFITILIGIGAAVLGLFLSNLFGIYGHATVKLWFLKWDWWVLVVQVFLAVVGIVGAQALTHTFLTSSGKPRKRRSSSGSTRRRRTPKKDEDD